MTVLELVEQLQDVPVGFKVKDSDGRELSIVWVNVVDKTISLLAKPEIKE